MVAPCNCGRGHHNKKGQIMSQGTSLDRSPAQWRSTLLHMLRYPIVWLGLLVVLATPTLIVGIPRVLQHTTPAPADLFMQSVVQRDGGLGWHQLCPALQAQMPLALLASQVQHQRSAQAAHGPSPPLDYIGGHAQPPGGQIRLYVVTAHRPTGL